MSEPHELPAGLISIVDIIVIVVVVGHRSNSAQDQEKI